MCSGEFFKETTFKYSIGALIFGTKMFGNLIKLILHGAK